MRKAISKQPKKQMPKDSKAAAKALAALEERFTIDSNIEIRDTELVFKENNPEYDLLAAKIAKLESRKVACESEVENNEAIKELKKKANGRIAGLPGENKTVYSVEKGSKLKFEVIRADNGEVKSIVMKRNGKNVAALSAGIDGFADTSLKRAALADKVDRLLSSGKFSVEEMNANMERYAQEFEAEYSKIQPARARYTKEWNQVRGSVEATAKEAEDLGTQIAALKAKQKAVKPMTEKEGQEALKKMNEQDRNAAIMSKNGMIR